MPKDRSPTSRLYHSIRLVELKDHEAKIREFILGSAGAQSRKEGIIATLMVRTAHSCNEESFAQFLKTGELPSIKLTGSEFEFVRSGEWIAWVKELGRLSKDQWLQGWQAPLESVSSYWDDTLEKYTKTKRAA